MKITVPDDAIPSAAAQGLAPTWPARAWKSRLARRLLLLFGFAALVPALLLGSLSVRELARESEHLRQQARFQATKSSALYLHSWLKARSREMDFALRHHLGAVDVSVPGTEYRTVNGSLRFAEPQAMPALSLRENAVLSNGRVLVRTESTGPEQARILLLRRATLGSLETLVIYTLRNPPPIAMVLPSGYAFCVLNEQASLVNCSSPPPSAWRNAIAPAERRGGFQEVKLAAGDGQLALTTWNLFMDEEFGVGDWRVMTWQNDDFAAYSPAQFVRSRGLVLAAAVGTVLLLTLVALRRTLTPIRRLTEFAEALSHGNLRARLALSTGDEVERVGDAFNRMASRIERHVRLLERYPEIDRAILSGKDPVEVVALIVDHLEAREDGATAVALKLGGETAVGLRVGAQPPRFRTAAEDLEGIDAVFDLAGCASLAAHGRWAAPLQACGPAVVTARRVQATDAIAIIESGPPPAAGVARDTDEIGALVDRIALTLGNRAIERKLVYQSFHDGLTDLPNRDSLLAGFPALLQRAAETGSGVALLVIELDDFRTINESLGFQAGDTVLVEIAARLRALGDARRQVIHLRPGKFALVVTDAPLEEEQMLATLRTLVDDAQALIVAPLTVEAHLLHLSASFGGAVYPRDAQDGDELLKNADAAVERARQGVIHRRIHFYAEDMNRRASPALLLRGELQQAIENEAFVVHYQPKVDARTERLVGCEALVRWQHPERGLVMPGGFIVEAEQSGLIIEIGQLVLERACRQLHDWRERFGMQGFKVSVNLASRQFEAPDLDTRVQRALRSAGIPADALELEVTETVACADMARTLEYLGRLRALGIGLSLDDFGTGHSSLRYLQRMPISVLKIDRSFVIEIGNGPKGEAVIESVLALCHRLGLVSVAEGVETPAQAGYLREHGCDLIQGYLYGRPVPAEDFEAFIEREYGQAPAAVAARR